MPRPRAQTVELKLVIRNKGYYYIEWWNSAGRYPESVSCRTKSRREAEDALSSFRAGILTPPKPKIARVRDILDGYDADREEDGCSPSLKTATSNLRRLLGGLTLAELSAPVIKNYYDTRRKEGRRTKGGGRQPLKDGTLTREGVLLRAAIRWAIKQKLVQADEEPHIKVFPSSPPKDRWLSREEFDLLLASAVEDHIKLFIVVALATAGRKSAVMDLV